jgi:hypothetical protein
MQIGFVLLPDNGKVIMGVSNCNSGIDGQCTEEDMEAEDGSLYSPALALSPKQDD